MVGYTEWDIRELFERRICISVSLALNLWNVDMIFDSYRYLLLILGFNETIFLLFLYGFQ